MTPAATGGLRLAVGMLTVVPVGDVGEVTRPVARWSMILAPVAALPLAAAVALVLGVADVADAPPIAAGFLAVGVLALGTRAMHLDGLADTVDGFGAGWDRQRALDVMKRGNVGPMGVVALFVSCGIQATCFAALLHAPLVAAACVVLSRAACTALAHDRLRPARADGLGAPMVGSVPAPIVLMVWIVCLAAVGGALAMTSGGPDVVHALFAAIAAGLFGALTLGWLAHRATRIIGGITGDIFGAGVELALTATLLVVTCGVWW